MAEGGGPEPGTLITLAPAACPVGQLLRTAIDAEQIGVTRLHLPADQPDLARTVAALRQQTSLILTCDVAVGGVDVITSGFVDAVVEQSSDLPAVVAEVARLVADHPAGVGLHGRGSAVLPVLLASLAAGGHLLVGPPEPPAAIGVVAHTAAAPRPLGTVAVHVALVARASGLARISGRPPMTARAARNLLGVST